jgi:hypothetical protein
MSSSTNSNTEISTDTKSVSTVSNAVSTDTTKATVDTTKTSVDTSADTTDEFKLWIDYVQYVLKEYIFIIVIAFLAIFTLLRLFDSSGGVFTSVTSKIIDLFILVILFLYVGYDYIFVYSGDQRIEKLKNAWDYIKNYVNDSYSIVYTSFFILIFYTTVYVLGVPMTPGNKSIFVGLLDSGAWFVLISSIFVWVLKTFFGVSILDKLPNMLLVDKNEEDNESEAEQDKPIKPAANVTKDEVFNIGINKYTYEDAQSICKSYDARLATYDEIESAYNTGAEWCNYGWSDGQMAFFPTQKSTWSELQKDPKRKNDCGRPGVNGGYMANPYLRFGVNCYGKKPEPNPSELARMNIRKEKIVPKTKEDVELDMKVKFWKENADKLLTINSFNGDKWSQFK